MNNCQKQQQRFYKHFMLAQWTLIKYLLHASSHDKALFHSKDNWNSTELLPLSFSFRNQNFLIPTTVSKLQMRLKLTFGTSWPLLAHFLRLPTYPTDLRPLLRVSFLLVLSAVLWMEGGDGCTTVGIYLVPLNCTIENG